jgi:hypothetical protein
MTIGELKGALKSGVTVVWQGKREYESSIGRITAIILRSGPSGEDVFSVELTQLGCSSIIICRPEELRLWSPNSKSNEEANNGN